MAEIEGYRFSIDLEDRGMSRSLRTLAKEATTLKRIMQANFNKNMALGNSYGALTGKLQDIERTVNQYSLAIDGAKRDMADLKKSVGKANQEYEDYKKKIGDVNTATNEEKAKLEEKRKLYEDENRALLNLVNKQENYRNQISRLKQQYTETERQLKLYNGDLERTRSVMSGMSASISEYNRLLDQQGLKAYATKGRVTTLAKAHKLSKDQYELEISQTKKLQSSLSGLQAEYTQNISKISRNKQEMEGLRSSINKLNNAQKINKQSLLDLNNRYSSLEDKNNKLKTTQQSLINSINRTTEDLQKQTGATAKAATQMRKFKAELNSVHGGRFGGLARSISNVDAKLKLATSHTRAWASGLRNGLMTAGIASGTFVAGMAKSVQMAAEMQNSWIKARNLIVTGGESVKAATKGVATMQRDATKYSKEYGFSQKEIADQYTELIKRGYTTKASIGSMKSMLEAARASGDDFNDVVQSSSQVLDAFGLQSNKASIQMQNTKRVVNAMAYAADMTATNFKNLGVAMSYVSASASQAGFSVEQTSAAVGVLSNAGIEGSMAGTSLRKVINSIIAPTAAAQKALKGVGLSVDDFRTKSGALKSMPEIFGMLEKHTKNLGKADKGAFFKALFGTTGEQAGSILADSMSKMKGTNKNLESLTENIKKAEKGNGYVHRLAQKNMMSTQMQMKQLKMNIQDIAINLGQKLLPAVNQVARSFSNWVGSKSGQQAIKQFSDSIKGVAKTIANNSQSIFSFLGGFSEGLIYGAKAVTAFAKVLFFPVTLLSKLVGWMAKATGHSKDIPKWAGIATGAIVSVVAGLKILHTAISGVNAVKDDLRGLGVMKDTTAQIKEQDSLYERMIELQEESLRLSKAQAEQQGVNTEELGKNTATQEAENIASDIPTSGKKKVEVEPEIKETKVGKVRSFFNEKLPLFGKAGGELAGTKMSIGILGKLKAMPKLLKGLGIVATITDLVGSAFAALDLGKTVWKGLTSSKSKNRYQSAGKAAAEGFAWYFGGPLAAQFAGFATDWAYKAVDSFKKGWNGYTKGYKPKGFIAKVGWDFKDATRRYNNWIASIERKHPVIAGYFRWSRGVWSTAFSTVKFFMRNVHAGFKEMCDTISDLGTLNFSKWKKDLHNDSHGMINGVKNDWKGFFSWFTKNRTKVTLHKPKKSSRSSSSSKSSSSSSNTFKSAGNVKYSKSDIANLKAMTKAIGSYKSALKGLKSYVKNNDPSKQMNSMVRNMSKSVKGWDKLAKPIKKIGDAFKTLSKFASSMAKYDAFAALNNDLPKLEATLSKSKIGSKLKDISSQIKSSHIIGRMKDLTSEIKSDTSKWKAFAKPLKTVGAYMKDFAKAMDSMAGKGSSLQKFITLLPQMASALDKNDIAGKLKKLGEGIKNSHVVGRLSDLTKELKDDTSKWKSFASPVKTIGGYMKDFEKSVAGLTGKNAPLPALAQQIPALTNAIKKNDLGGAIKTMASSIKNSGLAGILKSLSGSGKKKSGSLKGFASDMSSLASSLKKFNSQTKTYGGKKDPVSSMVREFDNLQTVLKRNHIGAYLEKMAKSIKKSKINEMLASMNKSVKNSAKNWKSIAKPMQTTAKSFKTLNNSIKTLTGKKNGFTQLSKDIKSFYLAVRKYPFGKQIANQARIANNAMSGKKTGFVQQFVRETNQMTKAVKSFGRAFNRDWKASWRSLDTPVSRALRSVESTVRGRLNDIEDKRSDFSSSFLKGWNSWIDKVKSDFKSGFNKLPGYAASAMKSIVSKMNKGITGVNKVISDFGGDKKLSAISYASGTRGGHPGGHMLVNDSNRPHWKELVKFPGKAWRMFEGRNVLIPNAPKGTTVINGETTYALNSRGLLPKLGVGAYADGTDDGDEEADKIVKNPFGELKKIFFGATSFNGSAIVEDLGTAMSLGLIRGIQNVVKKMAEEADDNGAAATPAMIRKAAARMGIHDLTDSFVKLLMGVIMTESGNRSIKQSDAVHDVNSGVDPAAGILQYTNRTFMTYAMPGHTNRYKPYDELLAFFNNSDWRNSIGYPGYAHGKPDWLHTGPIGSPRMKHFANGGVVSMNQLINVAEGNRPEAIIPWDINKRPRALNLINQTLDHMEQDGGGTGNIHRSDSTSAKDDSFKDKVIALLANIAGFSAQQIQAIMSLNTGDDIKSRRARSQFYKNYGSDQRISDFQAF